MGCRRGGRCSSTKRMPTKDLSKPHAMPAMPFRVPRRTAFLQRMRNGASPQLSGLRLRQRRRREILRPLRPDAVAVPLPAPLRGARRAQNLGAPPADRHVLRPGGLDCAVRAARPRGHARGHAAVPGDRLAGHCRVRRFIARYMGDGILAYFGYPRAHENAAERAIHAGLKLVDAVTALEPMPGLKLACAWGSPPDWSSSATPSAPGGRPRGMSSAMRPTSRRACRAWRRPIR